MSWVLLWPYTSSLQRRCSLEEQLVTAREQIGVAMVALAVVPLLGTCFHAMQGICVGNM